MPTPRTRARGPSAAPRSSHAGAFEVELAQVAPVPNPYLARLRKDGDAGAYAQAALGFVRGFTESSLRLNLFDPGAPPGEASARLEDFFARLEARFREAPERDAFEDWTLTLLLRRR